MSWTILILAASALAPQPGRTAAEDPAFVQRVYRPGVSEPRGFVAATYGRYRAHPDVPPPDQSFVYSPRLRTLFAAYDRDLGGGDLVGALDFDWWTNAQDYRIANVRLTERRNGPDRRTIIARFDNYDAHEEVRFLFVRQSGRWFLDDAVQGLGGRGDGWTLSALLRERPRRTREGGDARGRGQLRVTVPTCYQMCTLCSGGR
jgi:hypothetical protein